jgi:prepilin signal peptidase PulO-like enzyme (type II secretory pathway)
MHAGEGYFTLEFSDDDDLKRTDLRYPQLFTPCFRLSWAVWCQKSHSPLCFTFACVFGGKGEHHELEQCTGMIFMKAVVNGADLKLAAACAFLLGFWNGIAGLIVGLLVAVIVNLIKLKNKKDGFPLIPYLAIGFMMAYFI